MAMKNRKLFPAFTETNQSIECPDFCDPACPYNCDLYPDYYYLSPPPPPPPPPLSDQNHYISPYVIILVSVLASLFLLIGYYVTIVKSCFGWCCCSRNNRGQQAQTDDGSDEEFMDENRVDHPIWLITTVGLQQSIINSIAVCKYRKGEGLIEGTECSVCLNEFQEDETVRLLPKCNHAFHISCIDTWLRAHTNCPLCRAHIVFDSVCTPPPPPPPPPQTSALRNSNNTIDVVVDNQIENSEIGIELSTQNQGRNSEIATELPEANDQRISKADSAVSDCINSSQSVGVAKETQQMKRCVSMDSSSATKLFLGLSNASPLKSEQQIVMNPHSNITPKQDEANTSEFRPMGNSSSSSSSIAQHLHLSPVPMKRSISCGGRFFSSKRSRSMNSILPL